MPNIALYPLAACDEDGTFEYDRKRRFGSSRSTAANMDAPAKQIIETTGGMGGRVGWNVPS